MTNTLTILAAGGPGGIGIPFGWPQPPTWPELVAGLVLVVAIGIGIGAWLEYRSGLERTR